MPRWTQVKTIGYKGETTVYRVAEVEARERQMVVDVLKWTQNREKLFRVS